MKNTKKTSENSKINETNPELVIGSREWNLAHEDQILGFLGRQDWMTEEDYEKYCK